MKMVYRVLVCVLLLAQTAYILFLGDKLVNSQFSIANMSDSYYYGCSVGGTLDLDFNKCMDASQVYKQMLKDNSGVGH